MSAVELPNGFRAAGLHCGIKSAADSPDLAVFAADAPAAAAGVFTRNRVCGAPVQVSRSRLPSAAVRAVVINSGNANACTGERGLEDARWMTARVAEELQCDAENVLVCSTGLIGHYLPRTPLEDGIPRVCRSLNDTDAALHSAARAMMTTDTVPKLASRSVESGDATITVTGVAKGAAMIAPNMATMLAVVMTDARLDAADVDRILRAAVDDSFHCITVDGHTSTSDSVLLLANGRAGDVSDIVIDDIQQAVREVCIDLARAIIADGEGAGHLITLDVTGAPDVGAARTVARTIAEDALVKTAIAGADPNWGRIVSAAGRSGVAVSESQMRLRIEGTTIYDRGAPVEYDEAAVSRQLAEQRDVAIELQLGMGEAQVRFWTTDLTTEYVRLNSEYTT